MRPKSLKHALMLVVALLVLASGLVISQIVSHRYGSSLIDGAVAQAENIAHKLALDAADKVLINDRVALQKLLDDQVIIPIYHYAAVDMFAENLEGWPYENFEQNWYSKDLYKIAE